MSRRILFCVGVAAIVACVIAQWLLFAGIHFTQNLPAEQMQPFGGHAYVVPLEPAWDYLEFAGDSINDPDRSTGVLRENGILLGPAHSLHETIRHNGGGLFSHWGESLVFSARDGSDPRENGKIYSFEVSHRLVEPFRTWTSIALWASTLLLAAAAAIAVKPLLSNNVKIRNLTTKIPWAASLLYFLFFISGFSALVYQTAWQRMLGLLGGSDSISITIVVGAFLLGLGLGNLIASTFADRLSERGAVLAFALCEISIAAFAILSKAVFYDLLFGHFAVIAGNRVAVFLLAFAGLLVPTLLMGLSLPLLARGVMQSIKTASESIGWLYGLNTLGAAVGAFAAGYFLIGNLGYEASVRVAALLNLLVGAGALFLISRDWTSQSRTHATLAPSRSEGGIIPARVWHWCLLVFISGFIIISLEVIWFRVIGAMLQSTAYSFALVLSWFLLGDALGIILGTFAVKHISNPRHFFLWLQGATVLYAIAALGLLAEAHRWQSVSGLFIGFDYNSASPSFGHVATIFATIALVVVPPALLLGMSFPITQRAIQDDAAVVGQRVGLIQAANIFGNTAGSIVTGLILLHHLGTAGSLRFLGFLGLVFVIVLMSEKSRDALASRKMLGHGALAIGLIIAVIIFPKGAGFWSRLHAREPEDVILGEDRTGVALMTYNSPERSLLYIGGHTQSTVPFLELHGILGLIGPLVHPNPKSILVVGHGTGGTPYGAGVNPTVDRIRVVEIVGPTYELMSRFSALGGKTAVDRVLTDSRYERAIGDARHALYTDSEQYDVIEADALLPRTSLSGLLYSAEHFRQIRSRLKPGGIAVQWVPTQRIKNTFVSVFPNVVELVSLGIMLGSDQPIHFDANTLADKLKEPETRAYLNLAKWDPMEIGRKLRGSHVQVWKPEEQRPDDVNTDLFPKDEFYLNR